MWVCPGATVICQSPGFGDPHIPGILDNLLPASDFMFFTHERECEQKGDVKRK